MKNMMDTMRKPTDLEDQYQKAKKYSSIAHM